MSLVINGSGSITGLSVGGLPDGTVDSGTLATNSVDSAELIDGAVDNSHLADNAVGLAEMASGTDGNIISYDASGNPVAIATGSDGQVLTSTGAGSPPAFQAAGKLLKATSLVNTTRAALSTSADYWLSFGTVSKISATSSLIVSSSVSGFNNYSGVTGMGIRIDSTYRYGTYTYSAASNANRSWSGQFDFGTMGGSGTKTVYWGWKPANGVASKPWLILNPTASDDDRYQSTRSTITVWEVEA